MNVNEAIAQIKPAVPEGPDSPPLYTPAQIRKIVLAVIGEDIEREAEAVADLAAKAEEAAANIARTEALLRDYFTPKAAAV